MLYRFWTIIGLISAVVVAGCQPLERPFQPSQKTSLRSAPGPRASLYIAPILNGSAEMREGVAEKLQELGVAAFTGDPVPYRYSVKSEVSIENNKSYISWTIYDPAGRQTRLSTKQEIAEISAAPPVFGYTISDAITRSASEIDILLGGTGVSYASLEKPSIFVPIIKGAPGDGSETLAAAMQDQILKLGLDVTADQWSAGYILKGTVSLTPPKKGTQVVSILWQLERQNGEYVGKIEQKNRIRAGTLNGPWGPVANAAAQGGARGIYKLLRQVEADYFNKKS